MATITEIDQNIQNSRGFVISDASGDPGADEALVAAARSGDPLAFEALVKRHQSRIFALALRYTRVREDAEDIVQQTIQKAFVYLHKFQGKSSFSTWLTRIAINESLMFLRRARAQREVPLNYWSTDEGTAPWLKIADASPDPEATCLQRERAQILCGLIARLKPGTRTVLELQELGELSMRDTARRMGLSVRAVKARAFRGRRELGEILRRSMRAPRMSGSTTSAIAGNVNRIAQNRLTCNA